MRTSDPFSFFFNNLSLFGSKTVAHLEISFAAVGVAMAICIPLGVWLGHLHRGSFVAINVSNVGRALPSLAVIAIGIGILGIGTLNVVVALVILAGPVMMTNAYRRRRRRGSGRRTGGTGHWDDVPAGAVACRAARWRCP